MIEIVTSNNISLDLSPDAEFQIVYEQPLLSELRTPVPFSTSIAFASTNKNNEAFRYSPFTLIEPRRKKMAATLLYCGVPLLRGCLIYDGIDNGKLNYTFSGKNLSDAGEKKIWKNKIKTIGGATLNQDLTDIKNGLVKGVNAPFLVNQDSTTSALDCSVWNYTYYKKIEHTIGPDGVISNPGGFYDPQDPNAEEYEEFPFSPGSWYRKYQNLPFSNDGDFTPCISAKLILKDLLDFTTIGDDIEPYFDLLTLLGLYKPWKGNIRFLSKRTVDIAEFLPDLTISVFLKNIAAMFCAGMFRDGYSYRLLSATEVLKSPDIWNIEDKVSDNYSISREEPRSYSFNYANSGEIGKKLDNPAAEVKKEIKLANVLQDLQYLFDKDYTAVEYAGTGDIYSGKVITRDFPSLTDKIILSDLIKHSIDGKTIESSHPDVSEVNNNIAFKLIKCVPEFLGQMGEDCKFTDFFRLAGLVPTLNMNEGRGKEAIIGLLAPENQICDKGHCFLNCKDFTLLSKDTKQKISLAPTDLWNKFHLPFASWLQKERSCISVDLNFSAMDILNFRMWRPVYFHGRKFLVKKMSVTFTVNTDRLRCHGEFISI